MATEHTPVSRIPAAQLRVMPLHAVTEVHGEPGLRRRLLLELDRLPTTYQATVADAGAWAGHLHSGQRRSREPYINHPLRVTLRILCRYRITDPDVLIAALLHDTIEDQPWAIIGSPRHGPPPTEAALDTIAARYNPRVAELVAAVTAPPCPLGADRIRHYTDHLTRTLTDPWARVIKLSDFTDNGVGIIHSTGPLVTRSARKYDAAVPILREPRPPRHPTARRRHHPYPQPTRPRPPTIHRHPRRLNLQETPIRFGPQPGPGHFADRAVRSPVPGG